MRRIPRGRPEPLGEDGGDFVVGEIACALASTLDDGPELVVREVAERGVDRGGGTGAMVHSRRSGPTTAPRLTAPEVERLLAEVRTLTAAFKAGGRDAFEAYRSHG